MGSSSYQQNLQADKEVTILDSASESSVVDFQGTSLNAMVFDAAFSGANVTFEASLDGVDFFPIHNTLGILLNPLVAASRFVSLLPADFSGVRHLRVTSNLAQTGDTVIKFSTRPLN